MMPVTVQNKIREQIKRQSNTRLPLALFTRFKVSRGGMNFHDRAAGNGFNRGV
jgi:hypothetical protein